MRRAVALGLTVALAGGAIALPAQAKKKPKAQNVTFYMHGQTPVGENDSMSAVNDVMLPMDTSEPTGAEPKSKLITNGVVTPNHVCAGNNLFPVWSGSLFGRVKGDVKLTLHTVGTPGEVDVRIWPDVVGSLCTSEVSGTDQYPDPAGEIRVAIPPGHGTIEAVIEDVDFTATNNVIVQITPAYMETGLPSPASTVFPPFVARALYDSVDFASTLEFKCTPKGKSCT